MSCTLDCPSLDTRFVHFGRPSHALSLQIQLKDPSFVPLLVLISEFQVGFNVPLENKLTLQFLVRVGASGAGMLSFGQLKVELGPPRTD